MKRTDMKITKEAVYYSSGETFAQFDVSFLLIETFTHYSFPPQQCGGRSTSHPLPLPVAFPLETIFSTD